MPKPAQPNRDARGAVNTSLVANQRALSSTPRLPPTLRGTQPRAPSAPPAYRYLGDLTDPAMRPYMTTRADPQGRTAYIDEYPASGLGVRVTVPELQAGIRSMMAGGPIDRGPQVTFVNDDPSKPSPRQPLNADAAGAAAAGIVDSGLRSVNINSTTGGHASNPKSAHNYAGAVDINRVNGQRVGFTGAGGAHYRNTDPTTMAEVRALQDAFLRQPDLLEDYGPDYLFKMPGRRPVTSPGLVDMHKTHVHLAMPRPSR